MIALFAMKFIAPASRKIALKEGSSHFRRCKPVISELATQIAQELCGLGDSFERIKGIGQTAPIRGSRHELRHALRAGSAYSRWIEPALPPDQPDEEIGRQILPRLNYPK